MNLNHTHLPPWLEKSWLFRKLFLMRKLFFTRSRFSHYSQMGEDIVLKNQFPKKYKGFFVDVGCFHPVKYNNTYSFYKKGWRGINIDIDSIKIEGFALLRPGDYNVNCAISHQEGEVTYWTNGFYTPTVTLDQQFAESREGKKYQYRPKKTIAKTLTQVIDESPYKDQQIDLLSIDVEGHDFEVLKSLDFGRYAPKIIAVESQLNEFIRIQQSDEYQFLINKGYDFINWVGMTLMFKKTENHLG